MEIWRVSRKIGLIAEDTSDIQVVDAILSKYMKQNEYKIKKFVGNGCGKLRQKCSTWAENLFRQGCEHVFVFHDLDKNNEGSLRALLEKKIPKKMFPDSLIVIPIEEMEAWLLSDSNALKATFNLKKKPKHISNCEEIKSPKEYLSKLIWSIGKKRYLNTAHNKKIAENTTLDSLRRCDSFLPLDEYIQENICI